MNKKLYKEWLEVADLLKSKYDEFATKCHNPEKFKCGQRNMFSYWNQCPVYMVAVKRLRKEFICNEVTDDD